MSGARAGLTARYAARRGTREAAVEVCELFMAALVDVIATSADPAVQSRLTFLLADVLDAVDEIKGDL